MIPDPAACRIGITAGHTVVNLEVWHPDWGSAATEALRRSLFGAQGPSGDSVPDEQAATAMLESALGVERSDAWLGEVTVTDRSPGNAVSMADLRERVDRMASEAVDPDGRPTRTELHVDHDGVPATAQVVLPLSPVAAPGCDLHVSVALQTDPVASSDLTMAQIEDRSGAVREALADTVSENNAGILAVTETRPGSDTLHFYLDSASPAVADRSVLNTLRTVASAWQYGDTVVDEENDPAWDAVRTYRV
ncbi:hypothetical protein PQI66_12660 [Corynebacterium sp. USCH3]|uniref:hypothetical protein n=1 Tax=Corynebacterium sp. USCH3 TaxID=3024840 RepID=UPI0030A19321